MSAGSNYWWRRGAKAVAMIDAVWTTRGLIICLWEMFYYQLYVKQHEEKDRSKDTVFDRMEARVILEILQSVMQKLWISVGLRVTGFFLQGYGIRVLFKANKGVDKHMNEKAVWIYTACTTLSFLFVGTGFILCDFFRRFGFDLVFRIICLMIVHINRLSGRKEAGGMLGSCGTACCWKINLQAEV